MNYRKPLLIVTAAVVVLSGWFAFRPERLLIDQVVSEEFPTAEPSAAANMNDAAAPGVTVMEPMTMTPAMRVLLAGMFHSNAHETTGTATIHQLADGKRVLRLTGFATSNGPDVRVYVVAAGDVKDDATVKQAGFIDLGAMKGNRGDQNYDVPATVDLAKYRAVTIWCRRFSVNFGTAPLTPAQS